MCPEAGAARLAYMAYCAGTFLLCGIAHGAAELCDWPDVVPT
jgi:hypothetical protein